MKSKISLFFCLTIFYLLTVDAQEKTNTQLFTFSGYMETYFVYDFGKPIDHNRPDFLYNFTRHNEVNLNFGFIQAEYADEKVRGKLALMTGTYANANLAAEPGVLKNIYEANVGVKLSENKNIWLDAGVFASHIGFESAKGAVCWNMTRGILAENSPYFLTGAKVTYTTDDDKWLLTGVVANGWQRIQRVPGNQLPAFGHQLYWTPSQKVTLNSSSFIGSDSPDSTRQMRYFHNFYGVFQLTEKFGLITGFDVGAQQKTKGSSVYDVWFTPNVIVRYALTEKMAVAARAEYYSDKGQVIIATGTLNGFQTFGYSVNWDVQMTENVLWRVEARAFDSRRDAIFTDARQTPTRQNRFVGTSLSLGF